MPARPDQTESQLAALAAAADRANRPTSLLTIPILLVIVGILYAAWAYRALTQQRSIVLARQSQVRDVARLVNEIKRHKTKAVNFETLYPGAPFMGSQIGTDTWNSPTAGFREPPMVSQVTSNRVDPTSPLYRSDVTATVQNEDLAAIFKAVDATITNDHLKGRVFISQAQLTPTGTGWRATFRFSLYEKK